MKTAPASVRLGFLAMGAGLVAILGLTVVNITQGNPIERGLVAEISATDKALSPDTVTCMAKGAAHRISMGAMQQPGPRIVAETLRADAVAKAFIACTS